MEVIQIKLFVLLLTVVHLLKKARKCLNNMERLGTIGPAFSVATKKLYQLRQLLVVLA